MNKLFSGTLLFSFLIHLPILFHSYTAESKPFSGFSPVPPQEKQTILYYYPLEEKKVDREIIKEPIKQAPLSGRQMTREEYLKFEEEKKKEPEEVKNIPKLEEEKLEKIKRDPSSKKLVPTVENVTLNTERERKIFFAYYDLIRKKIKENILYPKRAKLFSVEGAAYVSFVLIKTGNIQEIILLQSSGYEILDNAAIQSIQNAVPFPPFPQSLSEERIKLNIPISFELS